MRDHIISIFLCLLQVTAGLALTALLSHSLGITDYGFYVTFVSGILILAVLSQFGVPDIIMRETAARRAKQQESLREIWRGGDIVILPTLMLCLAAGALALRISQGELPDTGLLILMALHLPLMALLALRTGALRGLGKPNGAHTIMSILPPLIAIIILSASQISGAPLTLELAIFANAAGLAIALALSHVFRQGLAREDNGLWASPSERRLLRRESLPVAGIAGIGIFNSQVDVLMLGAISGAAAAGTYQVALSCAMIINILKPRVGMIVAHNIPDLWAAGNTREIERITRPVALIVSAAAFAMLLLAIFEGSAFLAAVFGEDFKGGAPVLVIISLSLFIAGLAGIVGYVLLMTGHQGIILRASIISALINLFLNPPLIYFMGPFGAAIAYMASVCWWSLSLWNACRKLDVDPSAVAWLIHRLSIRKKQPA